MKFWIYLTTVMMLASFSDGEEAGRITAKPQTLCPVMEGRKVSSRLYVDYEGERIYVCCVPCVKALKKNPVKFRDRLRAQGVMLETVPKK